MPITLEDDGLIIPEVRAWGKDKYKLVSLYGSMFTTATKNKWDCRVYIDLFSGAGLSKIKGTNEIVAASPLLALDINVSFDKYIFCEENPEKISALKSRCESFFPRADIDYVEGDANNTVADLIGKIPQHKQGFKVLTFCFADPYKVANLRFDTIRRLSEKFMDFLVLIPTHMDAHRNIGYYLKPENRNIESFLGNSNWRDEWLAADQRKGFGYFFADAFGRSMSKMGYIYSGIEETVLIRSDDKNLSLYRLAFFSRDKLGQKFWKEAKKYSNDQLQLL